MPSEDPQTFGDISPQDLNNAITVLVARLGEQFQLAERIDSKGRQVVAVCAAFYAGAQALAFSGFAEVDITTAERLILSAIAVVATGALIRAGEALFHTERPRDEDSFSADGIVKWFAKGAGTGDQYVSCQLVANLARASNSRAEVTEEKYSGYEAVVRAARWSLLLIFIESIVAIVVRI
jgi:hypothetical protein